MFQIGIDTVSPLPENLWWRIYVDGAVPTPSVNFEKKFDVSTISILGTLLNSKLPIGEKHTLTVMIGQKDGQNGAPKSGSRSSAPMRTTLKSRAVPPSVH